ncbi:ParA family protein [Natrialbaceae archaeon A-arb3/5]
MRGVTVTLQKGGVGKTTVAINVAERLAARGNDVVLVDVDPQGSATEGVGHGDAYTDETHLKHAIGPDATVSPASLTRPVAGETSFDLVPSNANLHRVGAELELAENGEARLYRDLVQPLSTRYDWMVFDAPPTIGALSNAALVATRQVLIPVQLSKPSTDALVRTVTNQLFPLRDRLSESIDVLGVVPNRVKGDNEEKRVLEAIEDSQFGQYLPPFARSECIEDADSPGPGIRERVAFRRAYRNGVPLATYEPNADMLDRFDALAATLEGQSNEVANAT